METMLLLRSPEIAGLLPATCVSSEPAPTPTHTPSRLDLLDPVSRLIVTSALDALLNNTVDYLLDPTNPTAIHSAARVFALQIQKLIAPVPHTPAHHSTPRVQHSRSKVEMDAEIFDLVLNFVSPAPTYRSTIAGGWS